MAAAGWYNIGIGLCGVWQYESTRKLSDSRGTGRE